MSRDRGSLRPLRSSAITQFVWLPKDSQLRPKIIKTMGPLDACANLMKIQQTTCEIINVHCMNSSFQHPSRRKFLRSFALSSAAFAIPGAFAEELTRTASVEEGPFYPTKLPLDTDNDLLIINDSITPAIGEVTHLSGRLLDSRGAPLKNALIEIWQVDSKGIYLRARGPDPTKYDSNFQGFGRFLTSSTGEYYFRTIKPSGYE